VDVSLLLIILFTTTSCLTKEPYYASEKKIQEKRFETQICFPDSYNTRNDHQNVYHTSYILIKN